MMSFRIDGLKAESLNQQLRGGHRWRATKTKRVRRKVDLMWLAQPLKARATAKALLNTTGVLVTLTRIGPRALDREDNLTGSLKAVRDSIAKALGVDDADSRLQWAYSQASYGRGVYAVEVMITSKVFAGIIET